MDRSVGWFLMSLGAAVTLYSQRLIHMDDYTRGYAVGFFMGVAILLNLTRASTKHPSKPV